jgi:hypothetical protein
MSLPTLLCLSGRAGVGKDTLADHLVREHGYVKYRFADPLKKLLNERFGWRPEQWDDRYWKEASDPLCGGKLEDCMVREFSPRSWAQWLGTEVGRTIGGKDVWVDAMWRQYQAETPGQRMVVCDARFDNEAASFWARGGDVLHIERPGAAAVLAHASEAGIDEEFWSYSVVNDCSIDEFLARAIAVMSKA